MLAIAEQNSGDRDDGMLLAMRQAVDAIDGLSEPGHD
jgi:hypothetical protein